MHTLLGKLHIILRNNAGKLVSELYLFLLFHYIQYFLIHCSLLGFQAYHSTLTDYSQTVGNLAVLPLRTTARGPAPTNPKLELDIIDEALNYFKANVFFRFYEIKVIFTSLLNVNQVRI